MADLRATNRHLATQKRAPGACSGGRNYGPPATTDAALFARIIQLRLGRDFEMPDAVASRSGTAAKSRHRADPGLHRTQRKRPAKLALLCLQIPSDPSPGALPRGGVSPRRRRRRPPN